MALGPRWPCTSAGWAERRRLRTPVARSPSPKNELPIPGTDQSSPSAPFTDLVEMAFGRPSTRLIQVGSGACQVTSPGLRYWFGSVVGTVPRHSKDQGLYPCNPVAHKSFRLRMFHVEHRECRSPIPCTWRPEWVGQSMLLGLGALTRETAAGPERSGSGMNSWPAQPAGSLIRSSPWIISGTPPPPVLAPEPVGRTDPCGSVALPRGTSGRPESSHRAPILLNFGQAGRTCGARRGTNRRSRAR